MKPTFTHKNHLKFGWGDGVYNFNDKDQKFWTEPGQVEYIPTSFKDECLRAARLIGKAANKPILVGMSGGVDSEVTARSFLETGIQFEAVYANIIHNGVIANEHDVMYARSFIKKYNIKYHEVNIEFNDLVNKFKQIRETNNPAEPYYKVNISYLFNVMMFKTFCHEYFCVRGGGDLSIETHRRYNQEEPIQYGVYVGESPTTSTIAVYEMAYRESVNTANFFCYTPEAWLAWLLDPDVRYWIKYEKALMGPHGWMNHYALKAFVLYKIWPEMEIRPKLTGFENIPEFKELFFDEFYINTSLRNDMSVDEFTKLLLKGNTWD